MINLKELSESLITRAHGVKAFQVLRGKLTNCEPNAQVLFVFEEDDVISFSFLDELLQQHQQFIPNPFLFLIPLGEISRVYNKLARIVKLRGYEINYIIDLTGSPLMIQPQEPTNLSNFEFEEKPTSAN